MNAEIAVCKPASGSSGVPRRHRVRLRPLRLADVEQIRRRQRTQYRVLYSFCGKVVVLSHCLTKEDVVPPKEIELAIGRKGRFQADPEKHTYRET